MTKTIQFKYASLNSNSLVKVGHPQTQSPYLRHLRLQQFNIISLQETHATDTTITSIELQLQAQQYLWTYYCGIVSYSSGYILTKIATSYLYESDRYILCKVHHPHSFYEPFYILNLYAPATSDHCPRQEFFESIYNLLSTLSETIDLERLLLSGDFNYDYVRDITNATRIVKTSLNWLGYLEQHFHNCLILNDMDSVPIYQHASSTIDFIFAGQALRHLLSDANVGFLSLSWSDHAILEVTLKLGKSKLGPELWRGNPCYANNLTFQKQLAEKINATMDIIAVDMTPQDKWEQIKRVTKKVIQKFGILQQELVDVAALKAGDTWREKGEKSAGYLKRLHQKRQSQQYMASLQAPGSCCDLGDAVSGAEVPQEGVDSAMAHGDLGDTGMALGVSGESGSAGETGGAETTGDAEDNARDQDDARLSLDGLSTDSSDDDFESDGDEETQVGTGPPGERPWISGSLEDMKSFAWQYYMDLYKADPVAPSDIETYLDTVAFENVLTIVKVFISRSKMRSFDFW
ncbi:uncharacterized protein ATC70_004235 [Mucor velutinosus]|uniref:Endonuclease/exonuclease/phosphatase domain-containing protein n=1 Tax=Mucor velutinosus TaxID=708070 RepID=A0AAN7DQS9_9FUNG|nr:hypothetical protein ATC70_004235 [Mucor velutinosus]